MRSYVFTLTNPDQLQQVAAMIQKYDHTFKAEENMIALSQHGYITGQEATDVIKKVKEALEEMEDSRADQLDPKMNLTSEQRWDLITQAVESYTYMEDGDLTEDSGSNRDIVQTIAESLTASANPEHPNFPNRLT